MRPFHASFAVIRIKFGLNLVVWVRRWPNAPVDLAGRVLWCGSTVPLQSGLGRSDAKRGSSMRAAHLSSLLCWAPLVAGHGAVVTPPPRNGIDRDLLPWAGPVPEHPPNVESKSGWCPVPGEDGKPSGKIGQVRLEPRAPMIVPLRSRLPMIVLFFRRRASGSPMAAPSAATHAMGSLAGPSRAATTRTGSASSTPARMV